MTQRLHFVCPSGHPLEASEDESGRIKECPQCGLPTLVPGEPPRPSLPTSPEKNIDSESDASKKETDASEAVSDSAKAALPRINTSSSKSDDDEDKNSSVDAGPMQINASSWKKANEDEIFTSDDPLRLCVPPTELVRSARHLTLLLLGLILVAFGPSALHAPWIEAPNWSRAAPMIAFLEIAYVLWMSLTPDYSTLRATAIMFFVGATLLVLLAITIIAFSSDAVLPFGLDGVRSSAVAWSFVAALLHFLGGYLCFHLGRKWRSNVEKRWERAVK